MPKNNNSRMKINRDRIIIKNRRATAHVMYGHLDHNATIKVSEYLDCKIMKGAMKACT